MELEKSDILFFTNEFYKVILILKEEEVEIEGYKFAPLIYQDIANKLHCTRPTVQKIMTKLKNNGYITYPMKGRIALTTKSNEVIKILNVEA